MKLFLLKSVKSLTISAIFLFLYVFSYGEYISNWGQFNRVYAGRINNKPLTLLSDISFVGILTNNPAWATFSIIGSKRGQTRELFSNSSYIGFNFIKNIYLDYSGLMFFLNIVPIQDGQINYDDSTANSNSAESEPTILESILTGIGDRDSENKSSAIPAPDKTSIYRSIDMNQGSSPAQTSHTLFDIESTLNGMGLNSSENIKPININTNSEIDKTNIPETQEKQNTEIEPIQNKQSYIDAEAEKAILPIEEEPMETILERLNETDKTPDKIESVDLNTIDETPTKTGLEKFKAIKKTPEKRRSAESSDTENSSLDKEISSINNTDIQKMSAEEINAEAEKQGITIEAVDNSNISDENFQEFPEYIEEPLEIEGTSQIEGLEKFMRIE
jgi:hypothetical protein